MGKTGNHSGVRADVGACGSLWLCHFDEGLFFSKSSKMVQRPLHLQAWPSDWELLTSLHRTPYPTRIMYSKTIAAIFLASSTCLRVYLNWHMLIIPVIYHYSVWLGTLAAPLPRAGQPEINARDCILVRHDGCIRDIAEDVGKSEPVGQA